MAVNKNRAFLKWAGGKYSLVEKINAQLPVANKLIEPFVGAGSVFLNSDYPHYVLNDINPDLISLYNLLKQQPDVLINDLKAFFTPEHNEEATYYALREEFNQTTDEHYRALLFVYLNRHGYNGLCRYSLSGRFNVPFGRYKRPYFPEREMYVFAEKSQHAKFTCLPFENVPKQTDTVIEEPVQQPSENARVVTSFTDALKTIPEPEVRTSESGEATQQSIAVPTASSVETTVAETATEQPAIAGGTESESADNVGQASESPVVASELSSEQPTIAPANVDTTTLMTEADPAAYYIQIAGMKDLPLAKDFLRDHNLTDKVTMYKTTRYGGDWYVLLWHTSAATLLDARAMVSSLPPFPGKDAVFVKSGRQIQGELNPAR